MGMHMLHNNKVLYNCVDVNLEIYWKIRIFCLVIKMYIFYFVMQEYYNNNDN